MVCKLVITYFQLQYLHSDTALILHTYKCPPSHSQTNIKIKMPSIICTLFQTLKKKSKSQHVYQKQQFKSLKTISNTKCMIRTLENAFQNMHQLSSWYNPPFMLACVQIHSYVHIQSTYKIVLCIKQSKLFTNTCVQYTLAILKRK